MDLAGTWFNELGSKMVLDVNGAAVSGKFETDVGEAKGTYELVGRTETAANDSQSVAFVVAWQNAKGRTGSCTAWCGQLQKEGRAEVIRPPGSSRGTRRPSPTGGPRGWATTSSEGFRRTARR